MRDHPHKTEMLGRHTPNDTGVLQFPQASQREYGVDVPFQLRAVEKRVTHRQIDSPGRSRDGTIRGVIDAKERGRVSKVDSTRRHQGYTGLLSGLSEGRPWDALVMGIVEVRSPFLLDILF
jgi:hypothetical protein